MISEQFVFHIGQELKHFCHFKTIQFYIEQEVKHFYHFNTIPFHIGQKRLSLLSAFCPPFAEEVVRPFSDRKPLSPLEMFIHHS